MVKRTFKIFFFLVMAFYCYGNELELFLNEDVFIKHQISFSSLKLLIVEKRTESGIKEQVLIVSNKSKVDNYFIMQLASTWFPVAFTDRYFGFGNYRLEGVSGRVIIIYDVESNEFIVHETGTVFLSHIFLFQNNLYYSGTKSAGYLKRFDLISRELTIYEEPYLPGAYFFRTDNTVFATQPNYYSNMAFEIGDSILINRPLLPDFEQEPFKIQDIEDAQITVNLNDLIFSEDCFSTQLNN